MHTRDRFFAALAALAAMLFAQAAFALAACDPVQAKSRAHMIVAQQSEAPCHEPADNAQLCLTHCQAGDQTLDKHQVKVPAVPSQAVLLLRTWPDAVGPQYSSPRTFPFAGPPPRILFRSLLI